MIEQWLIENYDERDFIVSGEMDFLNQVNPYRTIWERNQRAEYIHRSSCGVFSSMGVIMYNTYREFSQEYVETISLSAINDWIVVPGIGANFQNVVKYVCKRFDLIYNRVAVNSQTFKKALDNKRAFMVWMYFSKEMVIDSQDDGIIQWENFDKSMGHWIVMIEKEWEDYFINSYKDRLKYNRHKIENFDKLVENGIIFGYAYILYDKENNMEDIKSVEYAIEKWITKDESILEDVKKWNYTQDVKEVIRISRVHQDLSSKIENIVNYMSESDSNLQNTLKNMLK